MSDEWCVLSAQPASASSPGGIASGTKDARIAASRQ
jgi:hypothetical protein